IAEAARDLVAAAQARSDTAAEKISPPRRAYERFVARFPFAETPDQARAIEDVLRDLASGRPMHRLVCGHVGYGKTEVALRLAAKGVSFRDLALVVIDEEQRFGAAQKRKIQELGAGAHLLMLTATPIPRTLQAASVGLVDLSLIATPPARRQPIRTFVLPFDP